jgi:hypothetical protein
MMDKSHVSLEMKVCIVCGHKYSAGVLIQKNLRPTLERETVTGYGMCEEHQKLSDDGYLALVGIDPTKSEILPNGNVKPEGVYRTGNVAHIRRTIMHQVIDAKLPDGQEVVFVEDEVIHMLKKRIEEDNTREETESDTDTCK